ANDSRLRHRAAPGLTGADRSGWCLAGRHGRGRSQGGDCTNVETSLHREWKTRYAGAAARTEVVLDGYRIDAIARGRLIEVQHGTLAAIGDKVRRLCHAHRVLVVKAIVREKLLGKLADADGPELSRRKSPKRGQLTEVFDELVYFTR